MTDTYTFPLTVSGKRFQFTIKSDFFTKNKVDVHTTDPFELISKYHLHTFLHNPVGPAIIYLDENKCEYFLDGKLVDGEDAEKIKHTSDFNNKVETFLNSPDEKE